MQNHQEELRDQVAEFLLLLTLKPKLRMFTHFKDPTSSSAQTKVSSYASHSVITLCSLPRVLTFV